MTYDEVLEICSKVDWAIDEGNGLRYSIGDDTYCPVTFAYYAVTGMHLPVFEFRAAATAICLPIYEMNNLVHEADKLPAMLLDRILKKRSALMTRILNNYIEMETAIAEGEKR